MLKYIKLENLNCNNISQYYSFYIILNQINTALVSIRNFSKKLKKINYSKKFTNKF